MSQRQGTRIARANSLRVSRLKSQLSYARPRSVSTLPGGAENTKTAPLKPFAKDTRIESVRESEPQCGGIGPRVWCTAPNESRASTCQMPPRLALSVACDVLANRTCGHAL